ncbi:hypothetical protein FLAG1_04291 [Fusarium langsethiae]|uniref:Uncharacterized protein n=1 Tax=Fusarium langsethiae TaxID=179993 RepID=A0A0N0DFP8_FUSLA|nr:hypothetical protein FLAG1_04291 [Fusarium langsethiae]
MPTKFTTKGSHLFIIIHNAMCKYSSSKHIDSETTALLGNEQGATTDIQTEHPIRRQRRLRLHRVKQKDLGQLCGLRKPRSGTRSSDFSEMTTIGHVVA